MLWRGFFFRDMFFSFFFFILFFGFCFCCFSAFAAFLLLLLFVLLLFCFLCFCLSALCFCCFSALAAVLLSLFVFAFPFVCFAEKKPNKEASKQASKQVSKQARAAHLWIWCAAGGPLRPPPTPPCATKSALHLRHPRLPRNQYFKVNSPVQKLLTNQICPLLFLC